MAQVEYMKSIVPNPYAVEILDGKIICMSANTNQFSIYNPSSGEALRYTASESMGDLDSNNAKYGWCVGGGKMWATTLFFFYSFRIRFNCMDSNGQYFNTALGDSNSTEGPYVYINNKIIPSSGAIYTPGAWSSGTVPTGYPGVSGSSLYKATNSQINVIDTGDLSVIESYPITATITPAKGILRGDVLWWATSTGFIGLNLITNTTKTVVCSPATYPSPTGYACYYQFKLGSDGYFYRLHNTNTLVVVNPDTGQWKSITLSPSRDQRYNVIPYGDKLIIPSGKPDTWV